MEAGEPGEEDIDMDGEEDRDGGLGDVRRRRRSDGGSGQRFLSTSAVSVQNIKKIHRFIS